MENDGQSYSNSDPNWQQEPAYYGQEIAPQHDDTSTVMQWFHFERSFWITKALVASNVAVFIIMVIMSGVQSLIMPGIDTLLNLGALYGPDVFDGQTWRLWTSCFLHAGALHLAMNMYVLWFVGQIIERIYGSFRFLIIYLIAGFGGSLNMLFWSPVAVGIGASGAVFGAFGALLAFFQANRNIFPPKMFQERMRGITLFIVINLVYGFIMPGIGNSAHIGGLVAGYLAGLCLIPSDVKSTRWRFKNFAQLALLIFGLVVFFNIDKLGGLDLSSDLALMRTSDTMKAKDTKRILSMLNNRLAHKPDDLRALVARAVVYNMIGQYNGAINDCNKVLSTAPNNMQAYLTRSAAYSRLSNHQQSLDDINHALAIKPTAPAYALRGFDYLALGEYQKAENDYNQAVKMDSKMSWLYNSLAFAKFAEGNYPAAITDDKKLLNLVGYDDESAPYAVILSALSYRFLNDNQSANQVLATGANKLNHANWPYPVIQFLQNQISVNQLLASADNVDKMTEVKTYLGFQLLLDGQKKDAQKCFKWVIKSGNPEYFEYLLTKSILQTSFNQ